MIHNFKWAICSYIMAWTSYICWDDDVCLVLHQHFLVNVLLGVIHNCQPFSKVCKTHARGEGVNKSTILAYALLSVFFSCPRSSLLFYCCFACISFVRLNIKWNQTPMWYLFLTPIIFLSMARQTTLFGNVLPKQNRIYKNPTHTRQNPKQRNSAFIAVLHLKVTMRPSTWNKCSHPTVYITCSIYMSCMCIFYGHTSFI